MATQESQKDKNVVDLVGGSSGTQAHNISDSTTPTPTEPTTETTFPVKSKRYKSKIWQHFEQIFVGANDKKYHHSVCNYCKGVYGNTTATSTLWAHLERCVLYPGNKKDKKQKTLESFKTEEGDSKLISWKFDPVECRKAIAEMIVVDELPFSFIERQGFKKLCNIGMPRLQLVSRITIAKDCLRLYGDLKIQLKSALAFHAHRVCLTTDTWTSIQNLSYMVLTAHFIDHNWKLQKRILNFSTISSHKGVAIGNAIESCMLEWGINKVFTMTVDNASSNDTAIAHMKKKLSKKNAFVLDGEFFHMRCCAHILNLIVRDGMKEEAGSIERIRLAVRYIRGSPQRVEQFKTCCELDENPYKNNLVLDVPTRWNYTYLMLETALKFQKSFERFEDMDPNFHLELKDKVPGEYDWRNARIFCKFLKFFYEVTNRLSGSLYVTSNSYFHDVIKIHELIRSWSNSHDNTLKNMALKMGDKFDKYWGDLDKINMMLLVAVVLDPCFKFKYVIYCYGKIYPKEVVSKLEKKLKDTLSRLYAYYDSINSSFDSSKVGESSIDNEDNQGEGIIEEENFSFEKQFWNDEVDIGGSKSELEMYLDEVNIKKVSGENFDILKWWEVNCSRFRVLSLMARDVLAIPVSTVASESAFSTGGRVLDQFRSSLSPKVAEALICAQDWLRAPSLHIETEETMDDIADMESTITQDPKYASVFSSPFT